jgi:hypothetical protein
MMKWLFLSSLIFGMQVTHATSDACVTRLFPSSQLLNVSASGWASKEEPLVACSIVNPEINRESGLIFFSETVQEDAFLEIRYVDKTFPVRIADNWEEEIPKEYYLHLKESLRLPARPTDAALVMHSDSSAYSGQDFSPNSASRRFGVCAYAYPKNGRAWTSVSISTMRQSSCPWQNMPPRLFFEK